MLKLSNIAIGTKLATMSGLGIVLVAGIVGAEWLGGGTTEAVMARTNFQIEILTNALSTKAAGKGMQLGVRDIRLAANDEALQSAIKYLDGRTKAAHEYMDPLVQKSQIAESKERFEKIVKLIDDYASAAKQLMVPLQTQIIELRVKRAQAGPGEAGSAILQQINGIQEQLNQIATARTLPIAAEMDQTLDDAVAGLQKRVADEQESAESTLGSTERIGLIAGVLTIVLLVGSAVLGSFSIARPIRKLIDILERIEKGDTQIEIAGTERGDEIGALAKAAVVIRAARDADMANTRIRTALDVVRSNVMVADENYNIIYMNGTLEQMMRDSEAELRKVLTRFDSSKLLGANMDIFHRNPAHQRMVLDALNGTHETRITVGSQKFQLVATAVLNKDKKRVGTVVEWRNETAEKAIEEEINGMVAAVIAGDFSKRVPTEGKKDFMLNLANAMNKLCETVAAALDDLVRMLSALAEGDLTPRITADYQGAFAKLKTDANTMANRLTSTIGEIKAAAREVTNASAEISTSTTDLSQRTEEQAASLEETSASMEEISATVKKNAENAQEANQSAAGTRDVADHGGQVVAKAVDAMARIEESSRKISDIIGVIDEIARQTNLLALNAAVEAARAGEAGRGFAVVASEVRSLAQRSSQAAKDIKDLITNSNSQVKDGVDLVNKAGTALTEIVESIKRVADIVSDIAAASAEQASGIDQVNKALTQMDEVTQQNSALVEENAATAKTLEHQAKVMEERVAFFRISDGEAADAVPARAVAAAAPRPAPAGGARPATAGQRPAAPSRQGTPSPKHAVLARSGPVGRMQAAIATALQDDQDWKEF